jgi:hypothetical protein
LRVMSTVCCDTSRLQTNFEIPDISWSVWREA